MYKDGTKRREADRQRQRRRRDKIKAKGVTKQGVTVKALPTGLHGAQVLGVDPTELADEVLTENRDPNPIEVKDVAKRGKDIKCFADLPPDVQATINRPRTCLFIK